MKHFLLSRPTWRLIRRELGARWRLLCAAFGSATTATRAQTQLDLFAGLNEAGQSAGVQVWDWDLINNTLRYDRNLLAQYGLDSDDAQHNPDSLIERSIHKDDLPRYRNEFVKALKGESPLAIRYRIVRGDGSTIPVQLRGRVFRGPDVDGKPGRAYRVVGITLDMSAISASEARVAQQADLQQQLIERLSLAAEAAGIGVWDWDLKTDRLRSDSNMARVFDQADADSFPNAPEFIASIVHPDDLPAFQRAIEEGLKAGDRIDHRYRHRHADGSLHHVQLHARVIRNDVGKPRRLLALTWDITDDVAAQEKIATQARQLREWIDRIALANESAGIGLWDWDLASGKVSSDSNMAGIFKDADLTGVTDAPSFVNKILHPDDRERFLATMRNGIATPETDRIAINFRYIRNDGGVHHVELHGRIIRTEDGQAQRFLGISWNITERVEAQEEVNRQTEAQRLLLERLNLATQVAAIDVWDWDLINDHFTADTHMTSAYGSTRFDTHGARELIKSILHPDDVDGYLRKLDSAIASGNSFEHRYRMRLEEGERYVQVHARVFRNGDGKAVRMLGISKDVTEEVKHVAELKRQADDERALRDRLNLATQTAGISIWDKDLVSGSFITDEQFWRIVGLPPDSYFKPMDAIYEMDRDKAIAPINSAFKDATRNEILAIRHRTSNKRAEPQYVQTHMRVFRGEDGKPIRLLGVTWDVTAEVLHNEELKRTADKERALVERLNVVTKAARISPWEFDLKANNFTWHGLRQECYGLDDVPTEEYLARLHAIVLPEDRHILQESVRTAVENQTDSYSYQFRVTGVDGKVHYMRNIAQLQRNARGKYRYIMGVTMDVTKEVEAAEQLRQQAEMQRALFDRLNVATQAAGIAPWEYDLIADRFSWHGERLKVLGLDDEPLDRYMSAIERVTLPEDRHILHDAPADALKSNANSYSYRYRAMGIDNQVHHMKNYVRILRSSNGTPYRLIGVTWDVTEEIAANEQLATQVNQARDLKERLSIASMAAGISTWEIDLVSAKFLWVENPLQATRGSREGDDGLENFASRLHPDDRYLMTNHIKAAAQEGRDIIIYRYRVYDLDGNLAHIQTYAKLYFNDRRRAVRALGVSWDVTKEVHAEEQFRDQAQQQRELMDRLSFALQAAGISLWEFDLKLNRYSWTGRRLPLLGLDDVPVEEYYSRINQLIHPDDVGPTHEAPRRTIKEGGDHYSCRYRVRGADGGIHHLQNSVRILRRTDGKAYRMVGITWDVTNEVTSREQLQKQAEQERRLIERLNIATDSAGISSWEIDLVESKFLWIENPIKSVQRDDDSNMSLAYFAERIVPEDQTAMPQAIRAAIQERSDRISFRYRAISNDGAIVHVQTFARVFFDDESTPMRVLGVSWDVTKEVEAAEQLRHQTERLLDAERRLERASLSSSEGHWEAELATGHLWCSSSFHALLGYIEGEIEPRVSAFDTLVHQDDRANYHAALREHIQNNERYDVETRMRMANGEYRWFRMRGMAERDNSGTPTVMAGSIHDVHQQKLVEDALNSAQRRFERAINGTQDGLWELDVSTDAMWCSPRLALLLGYPGQQLEAANFLRSLIHPDDAIKVTKVTESHYRHNTPFDIEVRLKTRSGDYRWYRARASADRDKYNRAVRLSGSLQDVTEARAAREELVRATEAAESASRAKSAFLANVSHEIRTPMNGIIGMTGLLLETQLDRTQRDYANTIRGSADSLLTVINDILDFSKIEAGKLDLENIELDLRASVEDVGVMMAFQAANKGLELIVNVHPEVPARVLGDPQRLRQCLINLVGNAIKFTKHGEIVIDVCAVGRHEGRVLTHFEVRDTGIGIPDNTLKTLFQPFVQADSSTTRHFGGTGLGLSIVRRLVEMMGGQVGVVSEVGKGSTFFFTLSLEPAEDSLPDTPIVKRGGTILIVDDNATNRRVLETLLLHEGYQVISAASGVEAMQQLQSHGGSIEMVITDFQMPDMDGLMLGERIVQDPSLANTRLVMLTSLDRQGDMKRLSALGFAAYLTKPVRARELLDCVMRVLSGEARQWQMEIRPMITRNSLLQAQAQQRFAGHVLLVEDNLVNQKVAARLLERLGCTVRIADHGAEGVEAVKTDSFAIVLMDLQMPVMDGLTAARAIRDWEASITVKRTPIIALTANAMRGDQERCEAAGMDGFLTKPIEVERLRDMLIKYGLATNETLPAESLSLSTSDSTETTPMETPPIDLARLNEITDGDAEFTQELIATFIDSSTQQLNEIQTAIAATDRATLARAAHKLKGACANIYAETMRNLASQLEAEAQSTPLGDLQSWAQQLEQEFTRAQAFLTDASIIKSPVKAAS